MSLSRIYISAFTILVAQALSIAASASPVLSFNEATGGGGVHLNRALGWRFNVLQPIIVDGLGWFDENGDGLLFGHRIGIWSPTGVLLTDASVSAGSIDALDGQFRTVGVPQLTLPPAIGYVVGGVDYAGDTERMACGNTASSPCNGFTIGNPAELSQVVDPRIQWTDAMYSNQTTDFIRPNLVGGSTQGYYGPSFSVVVPEPSCALMCLAALVTAHTVWHARLI
jgi:hypothetical protein